jgi:hypothetical protein
VEVVQALPVLLVDGDTRPNPPTRGADCLRDALSPSHDRSPVVLTRVVALEKFEPALLIQDQGARPGTHPRVVALVNLPRLLPDQQEALAQFLATGGGVLVTLGDRVEANHYNQELYRAGQGWLPAHLDQPTGNEDELNRAVSPLPSSLFHPALDLFRESRAGGLADARFPRWWKLTLPAKQAAAAPVALLSSNDPLLVERRYLNGRVLLAAVPLDQSWRTNLPQLPAFVPLAHELMYYLAGARAAEHNLAPGQPLIFHPGRTETVKSVTVQAPSGEVKSQAVNHAPVVYEDTREPGVYHVQPAEGAGAYYVVQADSHESDLTPATAADQQKVAELLPMIYENDVGQVMGAVTASGEKQELWWWLMLGVIALLCAEVWMTRRIVRRR